jgi:hypothetical protein
MGTGIGGVVGGVIYGSAGYTIASVHNPSYKRDYIYSYGNYKQGKFEIGLNLSSLNLKIDELTYPATSLGFNFSLSKFFDNFEIGTGISYDSFFSDSLHLGGDITSIPIFLNHRIKLNNSFIFFMGQL